MRRRQQQDLEFAKDRKAKAAFVQLQRTERERRISEIPVVPIADAMRDPNRLLTGTKASESARVTEVDLDAAAHRREKVGAHSSNMAMTGRDLQFVGRATPTWMRPPAN